MKDIQENITHLHAQCKVKQGPIAVAPAKKICTEPWATDQSTQSCISICTLACVNSYSKATQHEEVQFSSVGF